MLDVLAAELTKEYGKSYSKRNLQYFRIFYQCFPDEEIVNTRVHNLDWSHFRSLYSVLHDNDRLFMSKYLTYLPSKEQLKHEIERQKEIFYMQHSELKKDGEDA